MRPSLQIFYVLRTVKKFRVLIFASALIIFLYFINFVLFVQIHIFKEKPKLASVNLSYVMVHFDLKGAPPTLNYLESLLKILKNSGANALLMEYEDMFPFGGNIVNISTPYHYSRNELKKFLTKAVKTGFEIIPLLQTFGHMEFVLKLEEFRHLRELVLYPEVICPSNSESISLIREMLRQVIQFHQSIAPLKHIHIGCDEVYEINICRACNLRNKTKLDIFIEHVKAVNKIVKSLSPDTTVLIWDDMLRGIKPKDMVNIGRLDNIEAVYWDYKPKITVSHSTLQYYHKTFNNIWIASAFKGADGKEAVFPSMQNRIMNNYDWMIFIRNYRFGGEDNVYNFKGIILTGWSRYSHFEPLCELLPTSIPILLSNLLLIKQFRVGVNHQYSHLDSIEFYYSYVLDDIKKQLECNEQGYDKEENEVLTNEYAGCKLNVTFPLYEHLKKYDENSNRIKAYFQNVDVKMKSSLYTNMRLLFEQLKWCKDRLQIMKSLEGQVKASMRFYFDSNVYKEYLGYKNYIPYKKLNLCVEESSRQIIPRSWTRGRNISSYSPFSLI